MPPVITMPLLGTGNVHCKILSTACSCYYPMGVLDLVSALAGMLKEGLVGTMKSYCEPFQDVSRTVGGYNQV